MNIPQLAIIPSDLILEENEFAYLNEIENEIFKILNQEFAFNLTLEDAQILCLIIITCRDNGNYYPEDIRELLPAIKHYNPTIQSRNFN
jgi:hypothetical protein